MKKIGVLLSNRETKEPVGFVEIAPSGMLILAAFEGGIHPYALRPLTEELLDQPLYVKHADIISRDKVLSRELLIAESQSLAALINEKPRMLGKIPIAARSVESTSNLSAGQAQPAPVLPLPDFMSNPQTPSPSPFTIRVDHGGEDRPIEQFGVAIYMLLQLATKAPSWLCVSDARGGFVQIARRREGYIVEWCWEGKGVRRRDRLAYVATQPKKGALVSKSKRKLFTLYEHSFVHLGDAFEILHDFWVGKPRPNRFSWFDHSKDLAKLDKIKKMPKKGGIKVPTRAAKVKRENTGHNPRFRSKPKNTATQHAQKPSSTKVSQNQGKKSEALMSAAGRSARQMEPIIIAAPVLTPPKNVEIRKHGVVKYKNGFVRITAVFAKSKTCNIGGVFNNRVYAKGVPFSELEIVDE